MMPRTAPPVANVEPLAVSPDVASVLLDIGLTKTYELIHSRELETYIDGKNRKVTMRSIKARIARLLAANGSSTHSPPWLRDSKQSEQAATTPPPTERTSAEPPPKRGRAHLRKIDAQAEAAL
jgi:hypothetical protein